MRISDWSSDVCSSDLPDAPPATGGVRDFGSADDSRAAQVVDVGRLKPERGEDGIGYRRAIFQSLGSGRRRLRIARRGRWLTHAFDLDERPARAVVNITGRFVARQHRGKACIPKIGKAPGREKG